MNRRLAVDAAACVLLLVQSCGPSWPDRATRRAAGRRVALAAGGQHVAAELVGYFEGARPSRYSAPFWASKARATSDISALWVLRNTVSSISRWPGASQYVILIN